MIQASWVFLIRGNGIDPAGIGLMIRRYRIDPEDEPLLIDKVLAYTDEAIAAAEEKK
jgi:hypothetical protein